MQVAPESPLQQARADSADRALQPGRLLAKGLQGQLEVEGQWLTIRRKGAWALVNQGLKGDKRIPIDNITSVQFKPAGLSRGYIQFSLHGSSEPRGGYSQAWLDENSVTFSGKQQPNFEAVRGYVERWLENDRAQAQISPVPVSVADELRKLAFLRAGGVISDQEFEVMKARLIR